MSREPSILYVEDEPLQRRTLAGFLRKRGYRVEEAGDAAEALSLAGSMDRLDVLITDLRLGGPDGVDLLTRLRIKHPDILGVVVTAYGEKEDAIRAMRAGAHDFLSKPLDLERLELVLERALDRVGLSRENRLLRQRITDGGAIGATIGQGAAMKAVLQTAARIAPTPATVLILGESGTGKEVLARAIHRDSPRGDKPFVTVNLAAVPDSLVESELFGHEKGAFTGADRIRKGRFELADGGTLFLDEVGDIPLPAQTRLLNVLQNRAFERVGSERTVAVDVRVIAATHQPLEELISHGRFREDLYYRLNVVSLTLPPLRERRDDLDALVRHFIKKYSDLAARPIEGVSQAAMEVLGRTRFPGNIRQLENWIERAVLLADGAFLQPEDFPATHDPGVAPSPLPGGAEARGNLDDEVAALERFRIEVALRAHDGNQSAAARDLGVSERSIRYKMRRLGIQRDGGER